MVDFAPSDPSGEEITSADSRIAAVKALTADNAELRKALWFFLKNSAAQEPAASLPQMACDHSLAVHEVITNAMAAKWKMEREFAEARATIERLNTGIENLTAENAELTAANDRMQKILAADLSLLRMGPTDLGFTLETAGRMVAVIAGELATWLETHHAENYTETAFERMEVSGGSRRYIITVQRGEGQSPHQLCLKAETELATARAALVERQQASKRLMDMAQIRSEEAGNAQI